MEFLTSNNHLQKMQWPVGFKWLSFKLFGDFSFMIFLKFFLLLPHFVIALQQLFLRLVIPYRGHHSDSIICTCDVASVVWQMPLMNQIFCIGLNFGAAQEGTK